MRSKNLAAPKYQWLAELKQSGLSPKMEVLETVEGYSPTFTREEYWVKKLVRSGEPLTNVRLTMEFPSERKKRVTRPKAGRAIRHVVVQEVSSNEERDTGLKRIRGELGLTEEGMAKRLTVSYSTYRNAEKGKSLVSSTGFVLRGACLLCHLKIRVEHPVEGCSCGMALSLI
jgi:DNA-binding transcriptional regulator YiaG